MTNIFLDDSEKGMSYYPISPTYLEFIFICSNLENLVLAKFTPSKYKHASTFKISKIADNIWNGDIGLNLSDKFIDINFGNDES